MTDVLLTLGIAGAALQALSAVAFVLWVRYYRVRYTMRWAVRERARMTRIESIMWLAARRGRRALLELHVVLRDGLSPSLYGLKDAFDGLAEAYRELEPLVWPGTVDR